ncbi:MAG TPA: RnfABCDGE type electron transport complex subunit B, partial [bacterium]|nr:RnfABCDGE type electron transport complex subunit B [bacterium]
MEPVLLYTLLSLGGIGFILGAVLAFASKSFAVIVNPMVENVLDILPGVNCGGCGYAGCAAYAGAVATKGISSTLCAPGGQDVVQKISKLLGLEVISTVKKVAYLHCAGSRDKAKDKYIYYGIENCQMAALLGGGQKACDYGCLGFGDCVNVCKFDALHMSEDGLPVVDREKCTACGACVRICPKHLFDLLPDIVTIYLACSSQDRGKVVKNVCSVGSIGCGICVKVTESDAIEMKDNLPSIDYDASPNLILAHYKCPTNSYIDLVPKRSHMNIDTNCKGHEKCVEVCPVKDCITGEPGKIHHIDPKKCIGCGLCFGVCPEKAIHVVGA